MTTFVTLSQQLKALAEKVAPDNDEVAKENLLIDAACHKILTNEPNRQVLLALAEKPEQALGHHHMLTAEELVLPPTAEQIAVGTIRFTATELASIDAQLDAQLESFRRDYAEHMASMPTKPTTTVFKQFMADLAAVYDDPEPSQEARAIFEKWCVASTTNITAGPAWAPTSTRTEPTDNLAAAMPIKDIVCKKCGNKSMRQGPESADHAITCRLCGGGL